MPRPVALANGVYHLNIRVPSDLADKARGSRVTLPIAGKPISAKIGDKVIVSLRTKDVALAKARFSEAAAALAQHWEAMRAGPRALTHKQIVALAAEAYRHRIRVFEDDPGFGPESVRHRSAEMTRDVELWKVGDDDGAEISDEWARFYAYLERPLGLQLYAYEHRIDVKDPSFPMTYEQALDDLFGPEADALCAERQLMVDATTRTQLVVQIGEVVRLARDRLDATVKGDFSPDKNLERFPSLELDRPTPTASAQMPKGKVTVDELFARWCAHNADKKAASTARRYKPSIASLAKFLKGKDVRQVDQDDIWAWAEHRRDRDGILAKTVNRNDLVAAKSLFKFAAARDSDVKASGQRKVPLRTDNPVRGIKLDVPREPGKKDKVFKAADIAAILMLARSVAIDPTRRTLSMARRWGPWICAYSGARIQEVCWLKRENIWCEGGVWVMEFPMTKDGFARIVPIHNALIEEGLLEAWKSSDAGFLFVEDRPPTGAMKMSVQEVRAGDLASWIRAGVQLDEHLSPNHSWRHTFITCADGRMTKRMANRLAGHNKKKDASDGYYSPPVQEMKQALDNYPLYKLDLY